MITDLYIYADGIEYGVTTCAPIIKNDGSQYEFFGAFCLDVSPGGDLDRYFDFGEDKFSAAYILFNVDAAFRRKDINNSTFKDSFDNIFINSIEENNPNFKVSQATPIQIEREYARLYDGELLTWGQVTVRRQEYEQGTLTD